MYNKHYYNQKDANWYYYNDPKYLTVTEKSLFMDPVHTVEKNKKVKPKEKKEEVVYKEGDFIRITRENRAVMPSNHILIVKSVDNTYPRQQSIIAQYLVKNDSPYGDYHIGNPGYSLSLDSNGIEKI